MLLPLTAGSCKAPLLTAVLWSIPTNTKGYPLSPTLPIIELHSVLGVAYSLWSKEVAVALRGRCLAELADGSLGALMQGGVSNGLVEC